MKTLFVPNAGENKARIESGVVIKKTAKQENLGENHC